MPSSFAMTAIDFRRLGQFLTALVRSIALGAALALAGEAKAQDTQFETKAKQALMVEDQTGTILYAKSPDTLIEPAALAKLMTMEVVFHGLKTGEIALSTQYVVSENAWRTGGAPSGGSTMFAKLKSSVSVGDLIQGVIVQSANDGCIILAEGIAGSEQKFAEMMNSRAKAIGLKHSTFVNSTGLPDPKQRMSLTDLVALARHIKREYPEYYRTYAQDNFTWNNIFQRNRNPLLRLDIGADGMGTGYTEQSGYGIVGSTERNGRRYIAALSGLASDKERAEEAKRIFEWAYQAFEEADIFAANEIVGEAKVFGGVRSGVALKAHEKISILIPVANRDRLKAHVVYQGPLVAPLKADQQVGILRIWIGDALVQETPVYTAEAIDSGDLKKRSLDAVLELATGWVRQLDF
ncbi:D-alanyl-D-alanine carboxypeptidase family protein [Phyllobacterium endophyticum]|uniref:serine-type D-Ala-D-Ala carboxypeptidase n=1 Tax=Phyllobacterium endophyticum TaxID=1149773 RepID=A0A2P7AVF9_9HYPH|nr:D-alanyl-D-alanine carboxypeptidase family protein [Phyllobacterium endophyticum]MBB3234754.1 D-alanyl-D-alanine carboxypeptidase (penicillin-binding protein 5/6) [Phyllobacterium endophyticum]PSH58204.1 D-alanyl-D-alanine carboxypeptidase [Phyllobacterium endophyticum]TYR38882.1 D-alanyl-D-alanine carboxypeptidase [Phyllobacterium endophyticum]